MADDCVALNTIEAEPNDDQGSFGNSDETGLLWKKTGDGESSVPE
jgi:hypothetical protein